MTAKPDPRRGAPARFGQANVLRGLAAAVTGEVISLNLELDDPNPPFGRGRFERSARLHNQVRPLPDGRHIVVNDDEVRLALQGSSQWDSFAHFGVIGDEVPGIYHGGAGLDETHPQAAGRNLGIQALGPGIVTRGVLVDAVAELADGAPYLGGDVRIGRAELLACMERQQTVIEPGDAVLVHTGFQRRRAALDGSYPPDVAGLDGSTVELWRDWQVLAVCSDNPAVEAAPMDYEIHIRVLRDQGVPLGELWALDELATACNADGRYTFCLVGVPLAIHGAFGSPANAIAIR